MTDETFPHEIWADLDHWIEGPAASDLRAQGYMKYIRADRIEELEAKLEKLEAEEFTVGTLTMKHVFRPSGLTNVSDMQAVFDATERGFEELEARLAKAVEALEAADALAEALTPFAVTLERYSGFTEYALFGIWEDVNGAAGRKLNILRMANFDDAKAALAAYRATKESGA